MFILRIIFSGVTMSLRLVGPTLGFLFAAACLKIYISPTLTPFIKPEGKLNEKTVLETWLDLRKRKYRNITLVHMLNIIFLSYSRSPLDRSMVAG